MAQFYYNGQIRTLSTYTAVISLAEARADTVIVPDAVVEFRVGLDTATTIVSILPSLADSLDDASAGSSALNDGSLGVRLKCGSFEVFLAGDGEVRANGASGASAWLARAAPALALVSANGTTHPRVRAVTHLLQQRNLRAYCTNGHGTIEVRVNPAGRFRVDVERNAELSCKAGSLADT